MLGTLLGGLVASSALAYSTRPMTVVKSTDASGRITATCTFAEDTTGLVEKYNLYVVWGDTDAGRQLADWPNKRMIAEVTPNDSQVVVRFPDEALNASFVRVILGEPTYSTVPREDGITLLDYVEPSKAGTWLATDYTPSGTASLDMEFSMTKGPGRNTYATVFCARNTANTDHATYTAFIHQIDDNGGYTWRLDYGNSASSTETDGDLGFKTDGQRCHVRTTATGASVTMTVQHGSGATQETTTTKSLRNAGKPLCLFACLNAGGSHGNYATYRCYGFRATEAEEVKVNLLPARETKTVDGVEKTTYGLYDTVAGKFFSSGDPSFPLTTADGATASLAICDSSEVFASENDREVERSMKIVPHGPEGKNYTTSVTISMPATNTKIPYRLEAVYPDGTTLPVAEVGDRATNVTFVLPPHRNRENRKTLQFRLAPKLPVGYELVPYATKTGSTSSNGARIETDYFVNRDTVVSAKLCFRPDKAEITSAGTIFCSRSSDKVNADNPGQYAFLTYNKNESKFYWRYDYYDALGSNSTQGSTNVVYTLRIGTPGGLQVTSETSSYVVDGARKAPEDEFVAKGAMMLFASYTGFKDDGVKRTFTGIGNSRGMHIYWLTVKDATGDIMTLVPVKCTAEDEVGFWDFKGKRFLKSSHATDSFSAPEGDMDQSLIRLSESYTAPETIGLMMIVR